MARQRNTRNGRGEKTVQTETGPLTITVPRDCHGSFTPQLVPEVPPEGPVQTKAVYLALGITWGGGKELLGMWLSDSEGAKFWCAVCTELKNRGVKDGCIPTR